jgi:uncharacterized protein (TIGR03083 family)
MREQPQPDTLARECTTLIRAEVAALLAQLREGGDALWAAPSYCQDWAVKDVVAHLTGAFRALDGATHAVLAGRQPEHLAPDSAEAAQRHHALAAQPRHAVLAALDEAVHRYADHVEQLDSGALSAPVPFPFGPLPVSTVAGVLLSEAVIHHWDVRQPREPAAPLTPAAVPTLVSLLIAGLAVICTGATTDGTWQIDVDAPTGGPVTLRVRDGQPSSERGAAATPDAHVAISGEAFLLLIWGRLDVSAALADGRMRLVAGDRSRALALQEMFPGG